MDATKEIKGKYFNKHAELEKFFNSADCVSCYHSGENFNAYFVNASGRFLGEFGKWNESNGIVFNVVALSDSRYVVYL